MTQHKPLQAQELDGLLNTLWDSAVAHTTKEYSVNTVKKAIIAWHNKQLETKEQAGNDSLRESISAILVKWHMPTRQVVISEIVQLVNRQLETKVREARIDQVSKDYVSVKVYLNDSDYDEAVLRDWVAETIDILRHQDTAGVEGEK